MYGMVAGVIFLLVSIMHLARLILGWDIAIGEFQPPIWASVIGMIVAGYLSFEGFRLGKK